MKRFLVYMACLPLDILTLIVVLFCRVLWGEEIVIDKVSGHGPGTSPTIWCVFRSDSWPMRTWYKGWAGTTLGHGGILAPYAHGTDRWTLTQWHENVHVEHVEAECLTGLILGAVLLIWCPWWVSLLVWTFMTWLVNLGRWANAWLRGEGAYRGAFHEKAARAISESYYSKGRNP